MLAGSRSVRRRLYTLSECQRADDQRDRASRPNQGRGILGAGHSSSIRTSLHLLVKDAGAIHQPPCTLKRHVQGGSPHVR
jgi:hypothetical protein